MVKGKKVLDNFLICKKNDGIFILPSLFVANRYKSKIR